MDLTPPSFTPSPASPEQAFANSSPCGTDHGCAPDASAASYPSPSLLDFQYKAVSPYPAVSCSSALPETLLADSSLPSLDTMAHATWGPAPDAMAAASPPASVSSAVANGVSAEYDPFAAYEQCLPAPYGPTDSYPTSHSGVSVLPRTPPPSTGAPGRTPTPVPARAAFTYGPDGEVPRLKQEGGSTYSPTLQAASYTGSSSLPAPQHANGFSAAGQPYPLNNPAPAWAKQEFETSQLYSVPPAQAPPASQPSKRAGGIARAKRPSRRRTTREEANFQCEVKGCGKFFSRSYNFKSHMETHDEKREYPFPCPIKDCNKKFVRKTDLQRHHQSVHMKERNHRCDYCARLFARKDTLRRHMEDGCSKRFDIGTLDLRAEGYGGMSSASRPTRPGTGHMAPATGSLPPVAVAPMMTSRNDDGVNGNGPRPGVGLGVMTATQ